MFKIEIKNKISGLITHSAQFETETEINNWIYQCELDHAWGLPESTEIIPAIYDEEGNLLEEEIIIVHDAEYTITVEDITEQIKLQKLIEEGKEKQKIGADIIAAVYAINESKQLSDNEYLALLADPTLQMIERLLYNGSLGTAKKIILTLDETYFSSEEKQIILTMLENY